MEFQKPTIDDFSNAQHDHGSASKGGPAVGGGGTATQIIGAGSAVGQNPITCAAALAGYLYPKVTEVRVTGGGDVGLPPIQLLSPYGQVSQGLAFDALITSNAMVSIQSETPIGLPLLETVTYHPGIGAVGVSLGFRNCSANPLPSIRTVGTFSLGAKDYYGVYTIYGFYGLTSLVLDKLTQIGMLVNGYMGPTPQGAQMNVSGMEDLATLSLPSLVNVYTQGGNNDLDMGGNNLPCRKLTSLTLGTVGTLKRWAGGIYIRKGKLDVASVNGICSLFASLDGTNGTTVFGGGFYPNFNIDGGIAAYAIGGEVTDWTQLTGTAVTFNGITVTEGVEWYASTDNYTTAASLASALASAGALTMTVLNQYIDGKFNIESLIQDATQDGLAMTTTATGGITLPPALAGGGKTAAPTGQGAIDFGKIWARGVWAGLNGTVAATGSVEVTDYTQLTGKTITLAMGFGPSSTVITEGVEWTASTDNATTAASIAAAIGSIINTTQSVVGAVIGITSLFVSIQGNFASITTDATAGLTITPLTGGA